MENILFKQIAVSPRRTIFGGADLELIGRRFVAWTIDWTLTSVIIKALWGLLTVSLLSMRNEPYRYHLFVEIMLLCYYTEMFVNARGGTIGMRLVKIKVVSSNAREITYKQALMTYFVFSIYHLWYNRIGQITQWLDVNTLSLIQSETMSNYVTGYMIAYGKWIVFGLIYTMLYFTKGHKSFANHIGGTEIIRSQNIAR